MSDNILNHYEFTLSELELIRNNFNSHKDWEKDVFNDIKVNIRSFLRSQQFNKCCYCKRELGFDIKEVDIEHIIPKATHELFTFHHNNLALACPGCNTSKGDEPVLNKAVISRYPKTSANIKIVHPHYDKYSEHIEIVQECFYIGKTKKGRYTIDICNLSRVYYVKQSMQKKISSKTEFASIVEAIRVADSSQIVELLELLTDRLKETS